jgi:hypothetical protein
MTAGDSGAASDSLGAAEGDSTGGDTSSEEEGEGDGDGSSEGSGEATGGSTAVGRNAAGWFTPSDDVTEGAFAAPASAITGTWTAPSPG